MSNNPTHAQITQIRSLLIEDINAWLKNRFITIGIPLEKPERYEIPDEWLFLAGEMRSRYQDAGWDVCLSIEIVRPEGTRACHLVFSGEK